MADLTSLVSDPDGHIHMHIVAWYSAGVAVLLACIMSARLIYMHVKHYTRPHIQRPIIRIICMVPIYGVFSWLSLRFKEHALHLDLLRDAYEAFVLYNFVSMLNHYAGGDFGLRAVVRKHLPIQHMMPMNWFLSPYINEGKFVNQTTRWVLQYVLVKPATSLLAILLDSMGWYQEGTYSPLHGYLWITIINSISVTFAMNGLLYIYHATQHELAHIKPLAKLACIKGVLFAAFWQSVLISLLAEFNVVHASKHYTVEQVEAGLQDFLICFEMLAVVFLHEYAYSWREFASKDSSRPPSLKHASAKKKVKHVINPKDVVSDISENLVPKKTE
eukprot:TRINITY_DN14763_c0_g1_i2.p1 TRINITY_DN14763_c0_g1~~TRINITY_DN14763_c0_g1_i2.p1  ORF type:complete len:331 (-),score=65.52 TRINITY_DN14763_c0_g1_i2:3-995(-)